MPAPLPGSTSAENAANPSAGRCVCFDPLSGPKGSPLDKDNTGNASTGALNTGIGISPNYVIDMPASGLTSPLEIKAAGFDDDQVPGTIIAGRGTQNTVDSTYMYIGGGKSNALGVSVPYTAGVSICAAGNGNSRDGGAGPTVYMGFPLKIVTAAGAVANAAVVETGFANRTGVTLAAGQSVFGINTTQLAAGS